MKRLLALLLAAATLLSFAACGGNTEETTTAKPTETTTAKPAETTTAKPAETTTETPAVETTTAAPAETTTAEEKPPVVETPKEFDENKIVLSFAAVSDIHVNNAKEKADSSYLTNALAQLEAYAAKHDADGLDAIISVGDLTESYTYSDSVKQIEMERFNKIYNSSAAKDTPFLFVLGNHDHDNGKSGPGLTRFLELQGNAELHQKYDVSCPDVANGSRHAIIGNYHFLFVEPSTYNTTSYDYSGAKYEQETLEWLDATLANITSENPNAYVFVMTHAMIYDTVYGSDLVTSTGIYWYTKQIREVLDKYPQVVTFGGHLHFPLNDPRSIMQTAFTSLGCGSVNYMAIEDGGYEDMAGATTMLDKDEFSQGLLVQIDEYGNVRFTRMDFHNETTIGEPWEISTPDAEGTHLNTYGKDRANSNTAPAVTTVAAEMGKINSSGTKRAITVKFGAANDDEFAHHYELVLIDKAKNKELVSYKILSDFYRHGNAADMKQEYSIVPAGTFTIGAEYEVQLTAVDSWGARSETFVYTFTITDGASAPEPEAKTEVYADFDFADGKVVDSKGNVTVENKGATIASASVTHKGTSANVNALVVKKSGEYALCTFSKLANVNAVKQFAENGFSVEAFYVMEKKGGAVQGVVCGTQAGGWGLAEDKTGKPYFITGIPGGKYNAGAYAKDVSSTTELVHIVAVYDYANQTNYIYVNGVLEAETAIQGAFGPGNSKSFNKFSLGNDILADGNGGDFPTSSMTMVDAKIYSGALSAAEAKTAYDTAVSALK